MMPATPAEGGPKPLTFHAFKTSPDERWGSLDAIRETTRVAEELGYDAINLPEHVVVPADAPSDMPSHYYDKPVLAAHLAATTSRILFALYVVVVPYHPPIQLAKTLATLDQVTGGRLVVGTGVGWLEQEFELLGVPFRERGSRCDEYLEAMIALWTQESAQYEGRHVQFRGATSMPRCLQQPHVPLWIGGSGPAARRRVVTLGQGWVPMTGSIDSVTEEGRLLQRELRDAGRDPADVRFAYKLHIGGKHGGWHPHTDEQADSAVPTCARDVTAVVDHIAQLQTGGFDSISLYFEWATPSDLVRELEWFANSVMPNFR